jgi:nucleotide-binding universal stress UspA family protein
VWRIKEAVMSEATAASTIPTKILVPIDFSPSSHVALKAAAELAERYHAKIHLLHVIPTFPVTTFPDFLPEANFLDGVRKEAERHFTTYKASLAAKGIKVTSSIEAGNDVAGEILDAIEREHTNLIVISTHGMSGWYPTVFGSIAEKVVKLAPCPILLLRTPKPASTAKVSAGA